MRSDPALDSSLLMCNQQGRTGGIAKRLYVDSGPAGISHRDDGQGRARAAVDSGRLLNFLLGWFTALRWQRLPEMEHLGDFLLKHIDGIAAYCDHQVRFGVVESINTGRLEIWRAF